MAAAADEPPQVSVVTDARPGPPAAHGRDKLLVALRARDISFEMVSALNQARGKILILAGGMSGEGPAARLLSQGQAPVVKGPEALIIRRMPWHGRTAWVLGGSDDRGLMYAELDVADRIGWGTDSEDPLAAVRPTDEHPDVSERALSVYTMNRAYWESRFYDETYWGRYLDLLAQNRFNTLVVIFGYENGGFLAPPYPYFFDVEEFPAVRMVGLSPEQQRRNLESLNRLIAQAHARGLKVTLGIWDHIYRGGVQTGGVPGADAATQRPTSGLVWGVTEANLTAYTNAALSKLLRLVPGVDAIQFRMHDESGLKADEQVAFWRSVFRTMKAQAPNVRIDARAKGLPNAVIDAGLDLGTPLRITTKYWMEQMGLPFHPTHINRENQFDRRHGYADLLRYPQRYTIHWRLWNGGTARVLLWGDPEYVRRFAASTHLYDGDGFEVNEPLCTKMEAQPHDARPFALLKPPYRYYDYEFERYWHFFQVFGRFGYSSDTPSDVWQHEFATRFGAEAAPFVARALHRASWILPRIVAACYPYTLFPMTRGWAEKQRLGDLPTYSRAEGSDVAQFASFDEEAQNLIEHHETARTRPLDTSRWFDRIAAEISADVAAAEQRIGTHRSKEFDSTVVDLKILTNLARFHARRIPAAVSYRLYERTRDLRALGEAIEHERRAVAAWRQLVAAAGDVYADDLQMGLREAGLCGHWKDELSALERGLEHLEHQWQVSSPIFATRVAPELPISEPAGNHERPTVVLQPIHSIPVGQPLSITAEVRDPSGVKWVRLRYRSVNQQFDYQTLPMRPTGQKDRYQAVIPAEQIDPKWDLMYYVEVMDDAGHGTIAPDLNRETPYIVVRLARP